MREFIFEQRIGLGHGLDMDWGSWENQHGKGVYFSFSFLFFTFEFKTDSPLPAVNV